MFDTDGSDHASVKRVSNEGFRNLQKPLFPPVLALRFRPSVKKVPNGRLQGLDPGEIAFRDLSVSAKEKPNMTKRYRTP